MKHIEIAEIDMHCKFIGARTVDGVHQALIRDKNGHEVILGVTDLKALATLMKAARAMERLLTMQEPEPDSEE